jgi:hypothetical protein
MQLKECVFGGQANSTIRPGSCDNPQAAANSLSGVRINGEQAGMALGLLQAAQPHRMIVCV